MFPNHHINLSASPLQRLIQLYLRVPPQVEEPYDPERCLDYPLQIDLDLDRDLGDEESFDVEDCKLLTQKLSD